MRMKKIMFHGLLALLLVTTVTACGGGGGGGTGGGTGGTPTLSGSLDQSFGSNGIVTTAVGTGNDSGRGMAIQSDGKILVAGYAYTGSHYDLAVARYNTDGSLDTSFGTNGNAVTAVVTDDNGAYGIAIQIDGKIVVVGDAYNGLNYDFAVVRYNSNGTLDTGFGNNGKVTTAIATNTSQGHDTAYAVAIQGDNKIVVAGYAYIGSVNNFAVVRYTSTGALDGSFGSGGKVTTAIGAGDVAYSMALQGDGKIILAGYSKNGSEYDFAVVRYNTNGSLDVTFNSTGKATTSIGTGYETANGVAIQADGKIVLAGRTKPGTYYNAAMVRYNTDGSLDTGFGTGGKVTTDISTSYELGPGDDSAEAVTIQADGKIVAAGYYTNGLKKNFAVVRFKTDGTLDTTFGTSGVVVQAIGNTNDYGKAVKIDGSGKIVVAGYSSNGADNDFALARFNP